MSLVDESIKAKELAQLRLANAQTDLNRTEGDWLAAKASTEQADRLDAAQQAYTLAYGDLFSADEALKAKTGELDIALNVDAQLAQKQAQAKTQFDMAHANQYQAERAAAGAAAQVQSIADPQAKEAALTGLRKLEQDKALQDSQLQSALTGQQSVSSQRETANLSTPSLVREAPTYHFPSPPPDNIDTRNAKNLISEIAQGTERQKHTDAMVQSAQQLDSHNVYVGEFLPGDKAYAFTTAISGQAGIKSQNSEFYSTAGQVQTFFDHGWIDLENKTINRAAIQDYLGLPINNEANCIVEKTVEARTAYIETRIGPMNSERRTEFAVETAQRTGGGYQALVDTEQLNQGREDNTTLPIANWKNGQTLDLRGYTEDTRPFGPEQSKALVEDYAQRRTQATEISAEDERKEAMQQWLQSAPNYQNQTQERRIEEEREQGFDR